MSETGCVGTIESMDVKPEVKEEITIDEHQLEFPFRAEHDLHNKDTCFVDVDHLTSSQLTNTDTGSDPLHAQDAITFNQMEVPVNASTNYQVVSTDTKMQGQTTQQRSDEFMKVSSSGEEVGFKMPKLNEPGSQSDMGELLEAKCASNKYTVEEDKISQMKQPKTFVALWPREEEGPIPNATQGVKTFTLEQGQGDSLDTSKLNKHKTLLTKRPMEDIENTSKTSLHQDKLARTCMGKQGEDKNEKFKSLENKEEAVVALMPRLGTGNKFTKLAPNNKAFTHSQEWKRKVAQLIQPQQYSDKFRRMSLMQPKQIMINQKSVTHDVPHTWGQKVYQNRHMNTSHSYQTDKIKEHSGELSQTLNQRFSSIPNGQMKDKSQEHNSTIPELSHTIRGISYKQSNPIMGTKVVGNKINSTSQQTDKYQKCMLVKESLMLKAETQLVNNQKFLPQIMPISETPGESNAYREVLQQQNLAANIHYNDQGIIRLNNPRSSHLIRQIPGGSKINEPTMQQQNISKAHVIGQNHPSDSFGGMKLMTETMGVSDTRNQGSLVQQQQGITQIPHNRNQSKICCKRPYGLSQQWNINQTYTREQTLPFQQRTVDTTNKNHLLQIKKPLLQKERNLCRTDPTFLHGEMTGVHMLNDAQLQQHRNVQTVENMLQTLQAKEFTSNVNARFNRPVQKLALINQANTHKQKSTTVKVKNTVEGVQNYSNSSHFQEPCSEPRAKCSEFMFQNTRSAQILNPQDQRLMSSFNPLLMNNRAVLNYNSNVAKLTNPNNPNVFHIPGDVNCQFQARQPTTDIGQSFNRHKGELDQPTHLNTVQLNSTNGVQLLGNGYQTHQVKRSRLQQETHSTVLYPEHYNNLQMPSAQLPVQGFGSSTLQNSKCGEGPLQQLTWKKQQQNRGAGFVMGTHKTVVEGNNQCIQAKSKDGDATQKTPPESLKPKVSSTLITTHITNPIVCQSSNEDPCGITSIPIMTNVIGNENERGFTHESSLIKAHELHQSYISLSSTQVKQCNSNCQTSMYNGTNYTCNVCAQVFQNPESLASHTTSAHPDQQSQKQAVFSDNDNLTHLQELYLYQQGYSDDIFLITYPCNVCGILLNDPASRISHAEMHRGNQMHNCPKCRQQFKYKKQLDYHLKICCLKSAAIYPCNMCEKTFQELESCKIHVKSHVGSSLHFCKWCGVHLTGKSVIEKHILGFCGTRNNIHHPKSLVQDVVYEIE